MAPPSWYKHRGAWRAVFRARNGQLRYARVEHSEGRQWAVQLFDYNLRQIASEVIESKQEGVKALPREARTFVNRRSAK